MGRKISGGDFPLHNAVLKKNTEKNALEKILDVKDSKTGKQKYDINAFKPAATMLKRTTPKYGGTVLHAALTKAGLKNPEQLENIKFLVGKGADINIKDKKNKTPLDIAKEKNQYDIVKFLESKSGGKRKKMTRKRGRKKPKKKTKKKRYKMMKLKGRKKRKDTRKKRKKKGKKYTRSKSIRKRRRSRRNK